MHVGIVNPRWRGKRSRHSQRMHNPQLYVSGKRPMGYHSIIPQCTELRLKWLCGNPMHSLDEYEHINWKWIRTSAAKTVKSYVGWSVIVGRFDINYSNICKLKWRKLIIIRNYLTLMIMINQLCCGRTVALQSRHNERDGVSNNQPCHCLLNRLFRRSKHHSSASLAFVRGIHRWPVNFPHKWPVTRKMFPFHDVIMPLDLKNAFECFYVMLIVVKYKLIGQALGVVVAEGITLT